MRRTSIWAVPLLGAAAALIVGSPAHTQVRRSPTAGTQLVDGREALAREVLVKFRQPLPAAERIRVAASANAERLDAIGGVAGLLRLRSRSLDVAALIRQLTERGDVEYAEPNYIVRAFSTPNDTLFPQLWGLENTGQTINGSPGVTGADINATEAWNISLGSTAHVVAVVDTGVDYTHPDLAANMWSAPAPFTVMVGGSPVTCAAGTHGFNAITRSCNPMDDHNHGTHVAGTIGAVGDNATGVVGVNWTARIMAIKFLDAEGAGSIADAVNGIQFAIETKRAFAASDGANVRILSNSWGGLQFSQALLDAFNAASDEEMLAVAAAGNMSFNNDILPSYPASYDAPNIVAVAATTNTDDAAWFSNYGPSSVHLGAPGEDILSTVVGSGYAFSSGTSMAAPHVSGAAALVLSRCDLDTASLKDALIGTVEAVPALAPLVITGGRLDVNSAIHSCIAPPPTPSNLTASGGDSRVALSWSSSLGATRYIVKRGSTAGGPYTVLHSNVKGAVYTDTQVVNGTTYYYVVAAANSLGESGDSNEASATPEAPSDLIVPALSAPSSARRGTTISVSVTTKNQGGGPAQPSTTRLYLSSDVASDPSDTALSPAQAVPVLSSGATSSQTLSILIPADAAVGRFYLIARADADELIAEGLEYNNSTLTSLAIGPDLVVSGFSSPTSAAPGGTISATTTLTNQGADDAGASTTRFYLSGDLALDGGDTLLSGSRPEPGIAAGGTSSGTTLVSIPAGTSVGTYFLLAKADADAAVPEALETNNTYGRSLQIGGDLVISAFTAPASAAPGTAIVVNDTTRNQGTSDVGASVTGFYLSANGALDASDIRLDGSRAVGALPAGASSSGATTVTIPAATASGTYYLLAKADVDGLLSETQETNNLSARSLQIGSDLIVSAVTVAAKVPIGVGFAVTDTTLNQGGGTAAASATKFYLSTNATLDASDVLLAGIHAVPALSGGTGHSANTTVTIPSTVPAGSYYILAKADADNAVGETQETNNVTARSVQAGGDLIVTALTVPAKAAAGGSLTVSETIANQGASTAAESTTRFYLSADAGWSANDVPLPGGRAVGALAANANSAGSTLVTIPSGVVPGTYYLIAKADGDNAVPEAVETNNTSVRSIKVGPDLVVSSLTLSTTSVAAGSTVTATDTVRNQGEGLSGASTTRFFLSTNFALDAGDIPLAGGRAVGALGTNQSSAGATVLTIPVGTPPGSYYVLAKADGDDGVAEAFETNNVLSRLVQITSAP
jgi:subtilase family serine protease